MNFLFVTMPQFNENGARIESEEVFRNRISENRWAVYSQTRNKKNISSGDNVIFYVSNAKTGGQLVASAKVESLVDPEKNSYFLEEHGVVDYFVTFENVTIFDKALLFKSLLKDFTFCPQNIAKWGVILMGGIRRLEDFDYNLIIKKAKQRTRI